MRLAHLLSICIGIGVMACAGNKPTTTTKTGTSTTQPGKYSEDLSVWRPRVTTDTVAKLKHGEDNKDQKAFVEAKYSINRQLDTVLDSINTINLMHKHVEGFTIQVYSGLDRESALTAKRQLATNLPDLKSELEYNQPNFRVKTGKYFSRLEAQRDFMAIKEHFPSAIVIPDKFAIN